MGKVGIKRFVASLSFVFFIFAGGYIWLDNRIQNNRTHRNAEGDFQNSVHREDSNGVYQLSKIETKARAVQFENPIRYDAVRGRLVDIRYTSLIEATELTESPWNYNPRKLDDVCSGC